MTTQSGRRELRARGTARLLLLVAAAVVATAANAADARANGAFPDAFQILLPKQNAQQIILGTNFGLVISDDAGKTWNWVCEQKESANGSLYQLGPVPKERIFAVSQFGVVYSDDASCTWAASGGSLATQLASDVFPEALAPARVWAIAHPIGVSAGSSVYLSTDSGRTFDSSLYDDLRPGELTGVEVAQSDPQTVYVTQYEVQPCLGAGGGGAVDGGDGIDAAADATDASNLCTLPRLLHSADGGVHWDPPIDLVPALGLGTVRIVAVDPKNPRRIFLRLTSFTDAVDTLAISDDGGATFQKPVSLPGKLTAFLRLPDDTILVSGLTDAGPAGFRSADAGVTFVPWAGIPHLRALAERDGRIYGAADWVKDGYALGVSSDGGATFAAVMTFSQVTSVRACVQKLCQDPCDFQAGVGLWPPETCNSSASPPRKATGCGCTASGADDGGWKAGGRWLAAVAAVAALLWRHRRRDLYRRRFHRWRR